MLPSNFVIIGTLIGAVGSLAYLIDTLKGKVKPNRVSFLLWSIAPLIAFAAQIGKGVGIESVMTLSVGVLPLMIFGGSFVNKKAEWKLTPFDLSCGFLSIVGLIFWLITQEGNIAILFSIIADGLAAIPTVVKAYKYPESELAWPWLMTSIGVILTLLTLNQLTFANSGFIIYIFIVNTTIFALAQFKVGKRVARPLP
jgi:hypothetical protein